MPEPAYKRVRKANLRKKLLDFLLDTILPDYIDYDQLETLKNFVNVEAEECGEYGAFCDYFELGRWFEMKMEECEFDLDEFYDEYAREIERRAEE